MNTYSFKSRNIQVCINLKNAYKNKQIFSRQNIWTIVAKSHQTSPMAELDWAEMEGLFCQQQTIPSTSNGVTKGNSQPSQSAGSTVTDTEKKRKETSQVTLLDGKRSLNINIFLKQFRSTNEQICAVSTFHYSAQLIGRLISVFICTCSNYEIQNEWLIAQNYNKAAEICVTWITRLSNNVRINSDDV